MTSRRRTTSNQRWNNAGYVIIEIYNVQLRWNNVVYFNVELNNVRQRFHFQHQFSQRRVASKQRCEYDHLKKIKPRFKNKMIFLSFKEYAELKIFLILREICKRIFAEPQKFLKHLIYWITKSIFPPSHFVQCRLVFNFKRQVQGHYDYHSFNFICIF